MCAGTFLLNAQTDMNCIWNLSSNSVSEKTRQRDIAVWDISGIITNPQTDMNCIWISPSHPV